MSIAKLLCKKFFSEFPIWKCDCDQSVSVQQGPEFTPVTLWWLKTTQCFEIWKYLWDDSLAFHRLLLLVFTWLHVSFIMECSAELRSPSSSHHQTTVHLDSTLSPPSKHCLNNPVNMSVFIHYPASHHDQASRFNEANRYFCGDCLALPQSIKTIKWTHLFLIRS